MCRNDTPLWLASGRNLFVDRTHGPRLLRSPGSIQQEPNSTLLCCRRQPDANTGDAFEVGVVCGQQLEILSLHHRDDQRVVDQLAMLLAILPARVQIAVGERQDIDARLAQVGENCAIAGELSHELGLLLEQRNGLSRAPGLAHRQHLQDHRAMDNIGCYRNCQVGIVNLIFTANTCADETRGKLSILVG
jgi:hypothetical protein